MASIILIITMIFIDLRHFIAIFFVDLFLIFFGIKYVVDSLELIFEMYGGRVCARDESQARTS